MHHQERIEHKLCASPIRFPWLPRRFAAAAFTAGLALVPQGTAAQDWTPQAALDATQSVNVAVESVLEALRVVVIPAEMPYRAQMLSDVVQDAEEIQQTSRYLTKLLNEGRGYEDTQHQVRRISRNFEDLADNTQLLVPPEKFKSTVATLKQAVDQLKEVYAAD